MAQEEVVTKYVADVGEFSQKFQGMIDQQVTFQKGVTETGEKTKESFAKVGKAAEDAGQKTSAVGKQFEALGKQLVAAFAVERVIAFGSAAVKAFAAAEKAQLQLLNALGGQVAVQQRLLRQAAELQDLLGIDDDVIVSQQAFLALQGRTESQITKTIKAAIQLSAVTGEDLSSAVQKLDATYEGNIGRLGKLDSGFNDLSKSQLANGAAIDLINEKYKGFAEAGAASVSGQLEIQQRRLDELTEAVGKQLAPAMVGSKTAAVSLLDQIVQVFTGGFGFVNRFADAPKKVEENFKAASEEVKKTENTLQSLKDALEKLQKDQLNIADPLGAGSAANAANIKAQADTQKKIDEITGKAAADRAKASKDAQDKADAASEKATKDRLDRENKASEKALAIDLENLEQEKQRELAIADASIQEKLLIDIKYLEQRRKLFEGDAVAQEKIDTQIAETKTKINEQAVKDISDASAAYSKQQQDLKDKETKATEEAEKKKREEIQKTLDLIAQGLSLASRITDAIAVLQSANSQARIDDLETQRDEQLSALDEQEAALEQSHENRKISERKFENESEKIKQQRVIAEKNINKQIAEEKKKQAISDKERAIFETLINTASAIVEALPNIPLSIAVGILGGLELAAILATPIPKFAKGKRAGQAAGLSMVGEEGAELMFVPNQAQILPANKVRTFGEAIDAMYGNKWDSYINEKYITPALIEFKARQEKIKDKSFADNIANSLMFNGGIDEYGMKRVFDNGIKIKNVEQLANAIAKKGGRYSAYMN